MSITKNHFLPVLFLTVLFIVPILGLFNRRTMDETENRMLNAFPVDPAGPREFLEGVSLYLDDHFGLREHFIELHRRINDQFGAQTARAKGVQEGKDGWLFHTKNIEIFEGKVTQKEIDVFVSQVKAFQQNVAPIPVFIAVVPNKALIYEEKLPDYINNKDEQRFESVQSLKNIPGVYTLDLYDVLRSETAKTFTRHDTHWNGWGAFVAYQEIIAFINEKTGMMIPVNTDIETIREDPEYSGDLARMIGKKGELFDTNNEVILKNISACKVPKVWDEEPYKIPDYFNPNGRGKVFMMHDSFTPAFLGGYLSESFKELITLWGFKFSKAVQIVEKTQPDLILIEIVDRHIRERKD